ncbi:unnamed protein product [Didymodactylos carnosus]|uniref:Uncharacterized protein n=1 Tax=Didymodactylos carnosus TaxID=1234261 RepID=A0A815N7C2_9BILA|nr:unnamed protein product [Didymodactylos carnosus]CAF4312762.1 unnamed protein product [Didymodactylos carnosus]
MAGRYSIQCLLRLFASSLKIRHVKIDRLYSNRYHYLPIPDAIGLNNLSSLKFGIADCVKYEDLTLLLSLAPVLKTLYISNLDERIHAKYFNADVWEHLITSLKELKYFTLILNSYDKAILELKKMFDERDFWRSKRNSFQTDIRYHLLEYFDHYEYD